METQTRSTSLRRWLEKLCRFSFQQDIFVRKVFFSVYSEVPIRHIPQYTLFIADGPSQ